MTTIKPTQRDREAAASGYFAWCSGNPVIPSKMQSGRADDHSMVQAFARHAAAERALERAAIVEWLRGLGNEATPESAWVLKGAANAIEAGEHLSDNAEAIARGE
ncbi:MAG: hypothetical protein KG075_17085 [Alphaproteobacteria bacterium]|nr:hypothetical protein [Alphaproteobacteria bacterium]